MNETPVWRNAVNDPPPTSEKFYQSDPVLCRREGKTWIGCKTDVNGWWELNDKGFVVARPVDEWCPIPK